MTVMAMPLTGAPSAVKLTWDAINWHKVGEHVRQLQMRIAKAYREGKRSKARALQRILTHSFYAKLLAVKRVVQNRGSKTPGVDNVVWSTSKQKMQAVLRLKRRGYKTKPLKRIYIPKKQKGKLRPLSIPVMLCRGQQALHLLSLEPISETIADKNAYGFRPLRSTADGIEQCFKTLARKDSAQYILEADIKSCFDKISHPWLLENTIMDKEILRKWLAAGYIEKGKLCPTSSGTPQGGIISPTLLNVTLSGLEAAVKAATSKYYDKVNVCVYADDFIITGVTPEVLKNKVKPVVAAFLSERGLTLSKEKTRLTHISEGFDFLGINIRKYNGKLIMKPAKSSVKRFLTDIRETIKRNKTVKTENLIHILNPKIRGWSNYYRHVCSKRTFNYVDCCIFKSIWWWAVRRHPKKSKQWIKDKYFRRNCQRDWIFTADIKKKDSQTVALELVVTSQTPIKRHIKIRAAATPYDPAYQEYLEKRIEKRKRNSKSRERKKRWLSWWEGHDNKTDNLGC